MRHPHDFLDRMMLEELMTAARCASVYSGTIGLRGHQFVDRYKRALPRDAAKARGTPNAANTKTEKDLS
jgi:hypothetical protein